MQLYPTDEVMKAHARLCAPEKAPFLAKFASMSMDERWVIQTPQKMVDTSTGFGESASVIIVDDLLRLPDDRPVIAEGFRLLPDLVKPLLADPRQAVWLLPTSRFRQAVFERRGGTGGPSPPRQAIPQRALHNLLERDGLFTDRLAALTRRLGLAAITVEVGADEAGLAKHVEATLGLEFRT